MILKGEMVDFDVILLSEVIMTSLHVPQNINPPLKYVY